jgi:lipoprotein-anchoring transpeptidase ErfK/SrfK
VSNGCVRLDNEAITSLAHRLPLGTPVTIRR